MKENLLTIGQISLMIVTAATAAGALYWTLTTAMTNPWQLQPPAVAIFLVLSLQYLRRLIAREKQQEEEERHRHWVNWQESKTLDENARLKAELAKAQKQLRATQEALAVAADSADYNGRFATQLFDGALRRFQHIQN